MQTLLQNLWVRGKTACLSLSRELPRQYLLYSLLLLFLPTQLGKHFWPEYSLLSGFRVDYLSPTLYVSDMLLGALFFLWLVQQRTLSKTRVPKAVLPYLLTLIFLSLTLIQAYSVPAGLYSLLKCAELLFFGWYTARHSNTDSLKRMIPWIVVVTVGVESFLAIAQTLANGSLQGLWYLLGERSITSLTPGAATTVLQGEVFLRPYGTFSHPNVLAGFLLIGLTYLLLEKRAFSGTGGSILKGAVLLLGTVGLVVTLSRFPIVLWCTTLSLFSIQFFMSRNSSFLKLPPMHSRQVLLPVIFCLLLGILLLPFLTPLGARFTQTRFTEESFLVRSDLTRIAVQVIREDVILGTGMGNYLFAAMEYKDTSSPLFFAVQPVHNIFLLTWAEIGILGLFLFVWFLLRSFRHAAYRPRVLLSLVVVIGMFDHYFLTLQQGQLLLAFILGSCWVKQHVYSK
jgi:O-antigen ligase